MTRFEYPEDEEPQQFDIAEEALKAAREARELPKATAK